MPPSRLTNAQRLEICKHKAKNHLMNQCELARWATQKFSIAITQSAISTLLRKRSKLETITDVELSAKRPRMADHPLHNEALSTWVLQCQTKRMAITGNLIKAMAKVFANLLGLNEGANKFSNGWLRGFQGRNKLRCIRIHGESGAIDQIKIGTVLPELTAVIAQYELKDVFNMDETGLFYSMVPQKTIAQEQIEGLRKDKNRITVAFATNAYGSEKLKPFFIGRAKKPRCFNRKTSEQLGFYYRCNKKAWMTRVLLQEWLKKLNSDMKAKNRRILFLLDNATSHMVDRRDKQRSGCLPSSKLHVNNPTHGCWNHLGIQATLPTLSFPECC